MAYYGSRRYGGGYGSRGGRSGLFVRILAVVLVAALAVVAVFQTLRAQGASAEVADLKKQVKTLTEQMDELNELVPQAMLVQEMSEETLSYQTMYPEMKVENPPTFAENDPTVVYLTFDDGPSANTTTILDALVAAGQRATFFVVGKNIAGNEAILQRMVDEGHTIGIHTYSHDYETVYTSVESYLEDFYQTWQAVYDACGVYPTIFRFPGGSVNAYNQEIYQQIIAEMLRRGFVYYDWNASCNDATSTRYSARQLASFAVEGVAATSHPIVLLHDGPEKRTTAQAVPSILSQLAEAGYTCLPLTNTVRPVTFGYSE